MLAFYSCLFEDNETMNYSEVLRKKYQITLKSKHTERIDAHFISAAHHRARMLENQMNGQSYGFHKTRFEAHFRHMLLNIFRHGDFKYSHDESLKGLDDQEAWHPDHYRVVPDEIFLTTHADDCYTPGVAHPFDDQLSSLDPPKRAERIAKDGHILTPGQSGKA